jgi:hypothetical protein
MIFKPPLNSLVLYVAIVSLPSSSHWRRRKAVPDRPNLSFSPSHKTRYDHATAHLHLPVDTGPSLQRESLWKEMSGTYDNANIT